MEDKIKQIVEREFNAKALNIKRINEGYSHFMYDVTLDKEPKEVIVRFSNDIKESTSLAKEKYIMDTLAERNIPVPKIYAFDSSNELNKGGYMVMQKLPGKRIDEIWNSLTDKQKEKVTIKIGELLARIHEIKLPSFGQIQEGGKIDTKPHFEFRKLGEKMKYSLFLRELFDDFFFDISGLLSHKYASPKFISDFVFYILSNLDKIDFNGEPTLLHADYMPGHLFVEEKDGEYEITGLIDFEFALSYAPEYDFIKLHRNHFFDDEKLKRALEKGYGRAINEEAVEIYRLMRDLQFASVILGSGDKETADKVLKDLEEKINKRLAN